MKTGAASLPWLPIVGVLFVVLKLSHTIHWSWWWVVSPFILMIGLITGVISVVILAIMTGTKGRNHNR